MRLLQHSVDALSDLRNFYESNAITYGGTTEFTSLLTPCSVVIEPSTMSAIQNDFRTSRVLYSIANERYLASLRGDSPDWIRDCVEGELPIARIALQRRCAASGKMPKFIRLDYVTLEPERRIAEVQWKSGGPGLFLGLQKGIQNILFRDEASLPRIDAIKEYANALKTVTAKSNPVVVNIANDKWIAGEKYITPYMEALGIRYHAVRSTEWKNRVHFSREAVSCDSDAVDILVGQSFLKKENISVLEQLYEATESCSTILEPPPNVLLQQKWCLALPFFGEDTEPALVGCRDFIIPTALFAKGIAISQNIQHISNICNIPELASISELSEILSLPHAIRSRLVLKHAGCGEMSSDSRGVFRLTGSRSYAEKIINIAVENIRETGSSWILQPYIRQPSKILVCHPKNMNDLYEAEVFGRYLLFGFEVPSAATNCYASIANFSSHWKVTGSRLSEDPMEHNKGSTFTSLYALEPR